MSGTLIFNPAAGAQDPALLDRLVSALGRNVRAITLAEGADLAKLTKSIASAAPPFLAVAGGDGTVEAVASSLIDSDIPLGIIPAGTFNNFARSLDIPLDPLDACRVILSGATRRIDAGMANGRPFFESTGAGLDAALFRLDRKTDSEGFARWSKFLRRILRYPAQHFELKFDRPVAEALRLPPRESVHTLRCLQSNDSRTLQISGLMVTASNGPLYGMNVRVAPGARLDDGLLTISIFRRYSKFEILEDFCLLLCGRRYYCPSSITLHTRSVIIGGPRTVPVHIDGRPADIWPVSVECRPACLTILAPAPPSKGSGN